VVAAAVFLSSQYHSLPPPVSSPLAVRAAVAPDAVPTVVRTQLPHDTETLLGERQEPVNLILVGTQPELESAFRASGWTEARQFDLQTLGQALGAGLAGCTDPAALVTPSFLDDQPQRLAAVADLPARLPAAGPAQAPCLARQAVA